jgi:hypothetical protein
MKATLSSASKPSIAASASASSDIAAVVGDDNESGGDDDDDDDAIDAADSADVDGSFEAGGVEDDALALAAVVEMCASAAACAARACVANARTGSVMSGSTTVYAYVRVRVRHIDVAVLLL